MHDCSKDVRKYHDDEVKLPQATANKLKEHRNANRRRLQNGLRENEDPLPEKHVRQGSDAMRTTVQHPENDYDIDDGVVFSREKLKGPNGGEKVPLDARKMVCDALQDETFNTPPEVRKNCVRVHYNEGYHVDIPVYRKEEKDDSTIYELASAEWKESNPEGVTEWFHDQLAAKHPDDTADYQMRRMVRYLKAFGKSRPSWNMPGGFVWTVLVDEAFTCPNDQREDKTLRDIMRQVLRRVRSDKDVMHPVMNEYIATSEDGHMTQCETHLSEALQWLTVLDDEKCERSEALKAWKKVFNTEYFDNEIAKAEEEEKERERRRKKAESLAASVSTSNAPRPWGIPGT